MKRYDLEYAVGCSHPDAMKMVESADGKWVRFEDVEPTLKALQTWLDARKLGSSRQPENFGDGSLASLAALLWGRAWDK